MRPYALFAIVMILLLIAPLGSAQESASNGERAGRLLRIGYLLRDEVGHPGEGELEALRQALLADDAISAEMARAGYRGIGLYPCDGAEDMQRRLMAEEFEIAFVPAKTYASRQSAYIPVLKSRRPGDFFTPAPTNIVRRYGVVIVSKRSELFDAEVVTSEMLRAELDSKRLAVGGTQSAAGFDAPLLALATRHGFMRGEAGLLWMQSSEEVVKAVLSGLTDIGACEAGALEKVLAEAGLAENRDELVRVILETPPVVTDPVIVNRALNNRSQQLVRLLRNAIQARAAAGDFGEVQYVPAEEREYLSLLETIRGFETLVGEVPR